jgi:hypothetical protein
MLGCRRPQVKLDGRERPLCAGGGVGVERLLMSG